jgi:hypothetical protein
MPAESSGEPCFQSEPEGAHPCREVLVAEAADREVVVCDTERIGCVEHVRVDHNAAEGEYRLIDVEVLCLRVGCSQERHSGSAEQQSNRDGS